MKTYKAPDNSLHSIDAQYAYLLPAGCVEISDVEAESIRETTPAAPSIVTMRQARLALLQAGHLSTVNAAIAAGGQADQIEWEYAATVERNSPLVSNMALALGLTEQALDSLFTLAASL